MLMKYKDLGTMLSKDEMKEVKGGRACIPLGSGCSIKFQNCGCGYLCAPESPGSPNTICTLSS